MMKENWIWLDMDGTFADLYSVDGWLDDLIAYRTRPYAEAKPMYDMTEFLQTVLRLQEAGWRVGVVSWLSKDPNAEYGKRVTETKLNWLAKYSLDLILDKILITPYGVRKADTCRQYGYGILVDDEAQNRDAWDLGEVIDAKENILKELKKVIDNMTL